MTKFDQHARATDQARLQAGVIVVVLGLTLAAVSCSNGDTTKRSANDTAPPTRAATTTTASAPTTAATPSTSTSPAPAPTDHSPDAEIISRYIGFWNARFAANTGVPNPDAPALREFATGEQLTEVVNETRTNLERGLAFRPAVHPSGIQRVSVVGIDGDHAVVQECVVADGVIIRRDTGDVVNGDVATHNVRGELVRVDGVWKVSSTRLIQRWEGVAGCAHAS